MNAGHSRTTVINEGNFENKFMSSNAMIITCEPGLPNNRLELDHGVFEKMIISGIDGAFLFQHLQLTGTASKNVFKFKDVRSKTPVKRARNLL